MFTDKVKEYIRAPINNTLLYLAGAPFVNLSMEVCKLMLGNSNSFKEAMVAIYLGKTGKSKPIKLLNLTNNTSKYLKRVMPRVPVRGFMTGTNYASLKQSSDSQVYVSLRFGVEMTAAEYLMNMKKANLPFLVRHFVGWSTWVETDEKVKSMFDNPYAPISIAQRSAIVTPIWSFFVRPVENVLQAAKQNPGPNFSYGFYLSLCQDLLKQHNGLRGLYKGFVVGMMPRYLLSAMLMINMALNAQEAFLLEGRRLGFGYGL